MELNITNVDQNDLGLYICVSKNDAGLTEGLINLTGNETFIIIIINNNYHYYYTVVYSHYIKSLNIP